MLVGAFAFAGPSIAGPEGITVGVLNDQSGPYADITGKGSVVAAQMAIDDFGNRFSASP